MVAQLPAAPAPPQASLQHRAQVSHGAPQCPTEPHSLLLLSLPIPAAAHSSPSSHILSTALGRTPHLPPRHPSGPTEPHGCLSSTHHPGREGRILRLISAIQGHTTVDPAGTHLGWTSCGLGSLETKGPSQSQERGGRWPGNKPILERQGSPSASLHLRTTGSCVHQEPSVGTGAEEPFSLSCVPLGRVARSAEVTVT